MKSTMVGYKPASRAVRALAGTASIYNDALTGGRSFKVMGWKKAKYIAAAKKVAALGYAVTVHDVGPMGYWASAWDAGKKKNKRQYRLHVRLDAI